MLIKELSPKIIKIHASQEQSDKDYGSCLWYEVLLDCDNWRLNINSDVGNYSYSWSVEQKRTFPEFLCGLEKEYLLNKLSNRSMFDAKASAEETLNNFDEYDDSWNDLPEEERNEIRKSILNVARDYAHDEYAFYHEIENIFRARDMIQGYDIDTISVIKEYPTMAVRAVDIFINYIQPYLKEHKDNWK